MQPGKFHRIHIEIAAPSCQMYSSPTMRSELPRQVSHNRLGRLTTQGGGRDGYGAACLGAQPVLLPMVLAKSGPALFLRLHVLACTAWGEERGAGRGAGEQVAEKNQRGTLHSAQVIG